MLIETLLQLAALQSSNLETTGTEAADSMDFDWCASPFKEQAN